MGLLKFRPLFIPDVPLKRRPIDPSNFGYPGLKDPGPQSLKEIATVFPRDFDGALIFLVLLRRKTIADSISTALCD